MKNLIILFLTISALSCKKEVIKTPDPIEQTAASRVNYNWQSVCSPNDLAVSHVYGIKTTLTVKKLQATNYKAVFCSGWFTSSDGTYSGWAQVGYTSDMVEFCQLWLKNPQPHSVAIGIPTGATSTLVNSYKAVVAGETHTFSLELANHTLLVKVDGVIKQKVDGVPADYIFNPEIIIEGYGGSNKPPSFPIITFYPAFEYQTVESGTWTQAQRARSYGNVASWGAEGNNQDSSLPVNAVNMGSGIRTQLGVNLF